MREKELTSSLKHGNIVKLLNTAKDEDNLYFIFENCVNGSLDDLIKQWKGDMQE